MNGLVYLFAFVGMWTVADWAFGLPWWGTALVLAGVAGLFHIYTNYGDDDGPPPGPEGSNYL